MHRLTTTLVLIAASAAATAAEGAAASGRSATDLLGGATWSERRLALTAGLVDLDVDGVRSDQRAGYASVSAQAISGYQFKGGSPTGGILGLGAAANLWRVHDDVDLWAVAPYAVGIAGVYADINDRLRAQVTADAGPGFAYVDGDVDSGFGLGWTWGVEGTLTISKGDSRGLGVGLGYAEQHLDDFSQKGVYLAVTVGF